MMSSKRSGRDIAVIGYGYRLPGGLHTDADFWRLLSTREIVREHVSKRYGRGYAPVGGFSGPSRFASPWEGLITDGGEMLFDSAFFGISHNEMDPQLRMILNCAWESIESAGWDLHSLRNSPTGVFIGAQASPVSNWRPMYGVTAYSILSASMAMLANRVSYAFNLMGSSVVCCTACSAGLTALHTAIAAIHSGDCEQALVGSVNYMGSSRVSSGFSQLGVISPDGTCNSFDADANGYMRAEGAFMFAVKPLEKAEADGDRICAVIEATAINTAGAADGSQGLAQGRYVTAPTVHSQARVMRTARDKAGRDAEEIDYVEAHATGTVVGDRIEGNSLSEAFGGTGRAEPLRIAGVKSNLGHMEAAAFHSALLKVVLMMDRRTFAPISKNYLVPNLEIDFDGVPMQVQTICEPYPDREVVVGINSFGFGGTNGHCILREYRPASRPVWSAAAAPDAGFTVPLSARTTSALTESARRLGQYVRENETDLYAIAGNLGRRRTCFPARAAFYARSVDELAQKLDVFADNPDQATTAAEGAPVIAMVFSGQGTQWAGCGRELYETHPVFRQAIDAVEELWREHSDVSLRDACFHAPQKELDECRLAQPVIFMIQVAFTELYRTWGIHPDCVVGHSSGEAGAAYACGALALDEAVRLIYVRSSLEQRTAGSGRMLAIGLDRAGVEYLLRDAGAVGVEFACENSPASTVVCGKIGALRPVLAELERRDLRHKLLQGNIAFHSSAMEPIRNAVFSDLAFLDSCAFDAYCPMVSSVTGNLVRRVDAPYWWDNIRRPVLFGAAMRAVQRDYSPDIVLEIGPHSALQSTVFQCLEDSPPLPDIVGTLRRDTDAREGFHEALGALFCAGAELDFAAWFPKPRPLAHLLPGHPRNEKTELDLLIDDELFVRRGIYSHGPLIGRRVALGTPLFEARLSNRDFPWLADHRVHHAPIMPAAGYMEIIFQAFEGVPLHIEEIEFRQPCPIPSAAVRLQTALLPISNAKHEFTFEITSRPYNIDTKSELHALGRVRILEEIPAVNAPRSLFDINTSGFQPVWEPGGGTFYERLEVMLRDAYKYGPYFRTVDVPLYDHDSRCFMVGVEMDEDLWASGDKEGYVVAPPLMDGGLQVFLLLLLTVPDLFAIPQRAEGVTFFGKPTSHKITCYVAPPPDSWFDLTDLGQFSVRRGERAAGRISFYDTTTGTLVAHIESYSSFSSNPRWSELAHSKHVLTWQPKFVPDYGGRIPAEGDPSPGPVIAALEKDGYAAHVIELAGDRQPSETLLPTCVEGLRDAEYWLVGDTDAHACAHYDLFHRHNAALRFAALDPEDPAALDEGLLRKGAAELLAVHGDTFPAERWTLFHRLSVGGGLVVVAHSEGADVRPPDGWTALRKGSCASLFQAPPDFADAPLEMPSPRWVLGEAGSLAGTWGALVNDSGEGCLAIPQEDWAAVDWESLDEWAHARDVRAIDFFCGEDPEDPTGERVAAELTAFAQVLVPYHMEHAETPCRLTVVTTGAVMESPNPRGGALWGLMRTLFAEVRETGLDFRMVDLGSADDLPALAYLARTDLRERELAVRDGRFWASRMRSIPDVLPRVPDGEESTYRLAVVNPGQVSGLLMKSFEPRPLGPRDVEIDVAAAALNFRDVMVTLGLLPALAYERSALGHEVGMEAAGTVRRVGEAVTACRRGDSVAFIQGGCIANRIVIDEGQAFVKPERLGMNEAAASLSVYVTAYYALVHLAGLRRGQRVLVQSATGGVGQAAIAIAHHVGAEVYATAGNEAKRARLRAMGVRAAFDSHSFDWYDGLMEATGGEGVDAALNSLAGYHIELCLRALRPGGWHLEIGKVDIYADNALGMRVLRKNLRFAAIDVDRLMADDPPLARRLSEAVLDLLDRGAVPPLALTTFPYHEYGSALRFMMTGEHQGKLVLEAPAGAPRFPVADRRPFLDPDGTYLVTGGFGGVGQCLLSYLVVAGARHLTLMDRDPARGRTADDLVRRSALAYLDMDVELDIVPGDVSVEEDVRRCVAGLRRPLKGVFHLAGRIDDRLLDDLTPESFAKVFAPKAHGARHLHEATLDCDLDHFVLLSSIASALGNPGQANYSAASAYMDALAAHRRSKGLPALSYNMAAVTNAGMASRSLHVLRITAAAGLPSISVNFAINNLDYALRSMRDKTHVVSAIFARPPWTTASTDYLRTGHVLKNADAFAGGEDAAMTPDVVMEMITAKVAEISGHENVGAEEPLSSFGLTSISVAELGAFIQTEFHYQVSTIELMTQASALSLAHDITRGSAGSEADQAEEEESGIPAQRVATRAAARMPSAFALSRDAHFPS